MLSEEGGEESRETAGRSAQALRERREETLADQDAGYQIIFVFFFKKDRAQSNVYYFGITLGLDLISNKILEFINSCVG